MTRFALLCIALTAACGDNHDTAPKPDAQEVSPDAPAPKPTGVVVAGDFNMTGVMTKVTIDSLRVDQNVAPVGAVAGDPVLRKVGDRLYVINRYGSNNVTALDASTFEVVDQVAIGANTNPQDVAVVGDTLYVPALGTTGMVKVSASGTTETIDLGTALGDPDGHPDCATAFAVGTRVFVACSLLDQNFQPRGAGKVAVYDTTNGNVSTVTLPAENPGAYMVQSPATSVLGGDLLIPLVPSFTDYSTGCIARVSTGATPTASCAPGLSNSAVGGFERHIDVSADGTMLWLAVGTTDSTFTNSTGALMGYDLTTGTLWGEPLSPNTQLLTDVAACPGGSVVVTDTTFNASGLRVYGADGTERTTAAQPIGLPPTFGNATACYDLNAP